MSAARWTRGAAVAAVAALGAMGMVPAAVAEEPAECDAEFDELEMQTGAATFVGRNADKDEEGLLAKIAAAETKFSIAKAADADGKLEDYQAKVGQLLDAGKLIEPAGVDLRKLAADTRECVLPSS